MIYFIYFFYLFSIYLFIYLFVYCRCLNLYSIGCALAIGLWFTCSSTREQREQSWLTE